MKRKFIFYSFFILVFFLLQTTLLHYAAILGVIPNILIVFVIITGLLRGNTEGGTVGFFAGLVVDLVFGSVLGFYALLGLYLGIAAGSVSRRLFRENLLVAVFFTFVYSVLYESMIYIINNIMSGSMQFWFAMTDIILPESIYNSIIAILMFPLLIRAERWFEGKESNARKY
ncbi:MAG TPA: rod shape-determining protein MreD [Clostridia bacterium]|nr:rod shape-determining protein MreD [Clostridia bacterium]